VKVLHPQYSEDREVVDRFLQEARSASRIGHANIVDIADYGQSEEGLVFLVMEYLEGEELGDILHHDSRIPWPRARKISIQMCNALQAAHDKSIIHRDLKPGNIFLTTFANQRDFVKVIDFGIAKITDENEGARMTKTGMILGTPDYMSPEQATGRPLTSSTDIYSLGVILYEMLTGSAPFDSDSFMGVLSQHMFDPPQPPRERCPEAEIPEVLENITLKCLAKKPEDRFASMQELADTLGAVDDAGTGPTVTVPAFTPVRRPAGGKGHRTALLVGFALIASALIVGGFFLWKSRKDQSSASPTTDTSGARPQAMTPDAAPSGEMMPGTDPMEPPPMEPPPPASVLFSLSVNTPEAVCTLESGNLTVLRDGQRTVLDKDSQLGKLPLNQLEVVPQKEPVILKISHPDFEDLSLPILFDKSLSIERVLTARPKRPPSGPSMKPPMGMNTDPSGELLTPDI
jgi:serine/threonine-protein kinase